MDDGWILSIAYGSWFFFALIASVHLLFNRYDSHSALGWLGVIWLAPYSGCILYLMFGLRRVRRKGEILARLYSLNSSSYATNAINKKYCPDQLAAKIRHEDLLLHSWDIVQQPMILLDKMRIFEDGDSAYAHMLESINCAKSSILLQSYIFDTGKIGSRFVHALEAATCRGVQVYVLIDAIGARYSRHSMIKQLRSKGVHSSLFLPPFYPKHIAFFNLRNHRKILIVDNFIVFTGGMNIRDTHSRLISSDKQHTRDLHFCFEGELASHMSHVFFNDWRLSYGSDPMNIDLPSIAPRWSMEGLGDGAIGRLVVDGPVEKHPKTLWLLLLAINAAKNSIAIVTPYFLPDSKLLDALKLASLRGVKVCIVVPEKGNITLVNWAMIPQFYGLMESACDIRFSSRPFDHSKLIVIDRSWAMIGSSNWDMRSLSLNFELNLEIYDDGWVSQLADVCDRKISSAHRLSTEDLKSFSHLKKLRNHAAMLLTPYL